MNDRPLVITSDEIMLDELLRVAAAAQVDVTHDREPISRAGWRSAGLVLIDAAQVPRALALNMPRRSGVIAVGHPEPAPVPWDLCLRLGVERTLRLGESDEELIGLLADTLTGGPGDGQVLAVIGACGGAGASVFATAIATAADNGGRRVLLADFDRWGPGLDVMLGIERDGGVHWGKLAAPSGRLPVGALHEALPAIPVGGGHISVLCHDRPAGSDVNVDVVDVVLESGRRAGDLIVADLPRSPSPGGERILESADLVLLVATADIRSCFAGVRVVGRLAGMGVYPELVVRGPSPGGIGADDLADALGLPVLTHMRPQPFLARDLEGGRMPGSDRRGPLARAARIVLDRLADAG